MQKFDDELLLSWAMRQRFDYEAMIDQDMASMADDAVRGLILPYAIGSWWGAVQRGNGEVHQFGFKLAVDPPLERRQLAIGLLRRLNKEIDHDGRWVTGWTHGNTRMIIMWLDPNGDVAFTIDDERRWSQMVAESPESWLQSAEAAWEQWHHYMRKVIVPTEANQYKRAQGQRPPSATMH